MSSHKFLLVDSRDRTADSISSTQFRVILPQAVHDIHKVKLLACNIPNTVYNITNGIIKVQRDTTYTAIIPNGSYNTDRLTTAIAAALNIADNNSYTCTYSATTFKLTITGSAAFQILSTSTILYEMGFLPVDTAAATVQTSVNTVQLGLPLSVYIEIPQLTMGSMSSRVNDVCTWTIPIDVDASQIQYYSHNANYNQQYTYRASLSLHEMTVRIRTRNGQTLDINGADWQMILGLE